MNTKRQVKMVREGEYVAEIEVDLIEGEDGWSPYLSLKDARRLDDARVALRNGDIDAAMRIGKVYRLTPVSAA